ncbi:MAG: Nudix family hydrolase [Gammaproteobacteria bacterium]
MQHVAAAAIFNDRGEILLALRPAHAHQGNLWEFPGGKVEAGEEILTALKRELREELGIVVSHARPLIRVRHDYPDKAVLLDVWRVDAYSGEVTSCEGQELEWVAIKELAKRSYPAANLPIITAVTLPDVYLITPEPQDILVFMSTLERCLSGGVRLVQLRAKSLDEARYRDLAQQALDLCRHHGAQLLLNAVPQLVQDIGAHGVHLSSEQLKKLDARPLGKDKWVAASCHDADELAQARRIGVDFAVVSPVLPTPSHPGAACLGWDKLRQLTSATNMPIYALGGMRIEDIGLAHRNGAQGIAAVSSVWNLRSDVIL